MSNIEDKLAEEKKRIDSYTAPDELETRLREALNKAPNKQKQNAPLWKLVAVAMFFIVIIGYQYNGLAYYGKKLFGFDEMMTGTLMELNEEGLGQIVDETVTLVDGTKLTIEGVMADSNQLILYYSLNNPKGIKDHIRDYFRFLSISGFLTNSFPTSGTFIVDDNQTEIKGTQSFEPVSPFAKKLTVNFQQGMNNNQTVEKFVTIPYNPNKALQTEIKQSINKAIKVDKGTITFQTIRATPTMTVVEGKLNVENFDRVPDALWGIQLYANGKEVTSLGGGYQSSLLGRKFSLNYDALPKGLHSLELKINEFAGYENVDKKLALATNNNPTMLNEKELWIQDINTTSEMVEITIRTDNDVMLDGVSIETEEEVTPLKTIVRQSYVKLEDGQQMKERTLLFEANTEPEFIYINGMHFMKEYGDMIEIPVD
ncbi:DUF4179 domain-containing protein [Sutcliffiella cohnii]|uniref:DUF4179 domain-containing protein n=1 Tax=Sutcliffiella cohnii TaxID=33932 RepID=UPI002E22A00E|nr:DUF4179 domain-containing protein [Sutcliffiella cohnii]